jgi:hypothetical protein
LDAAVEKVFYRHFYDLVRANLQKLTIHPYWILKTLVIFDYVQFLKLCLFLINYIGAYNIQLHLGYF